MMITLNQIESATNKTAKNLTVDITWFIGIGIIFLLTPAFDGMSALLISLLSNGLIVGAIVAVVMDYINPS